MGWGRCGACQTPPTGKMRLAAQPFARKLHDQLFSFQELYRMGDHTMPWVQTTAPSQPNEPPISSAEAKEREIFYVFAEVGEPGVTRLLGALINKACDSCRLAKTGCRKATHWEECDACVEFGRPCQHIMTLTVLPKRELRQKHKGHTNNGNGDEPSDTENTITTPSSSDQSHYDTNFSGYPMNYGSTLVVQDGPYPSYVLPGTISHNRDAMAFPIGYNRPPSTPQSSVCRLPHQQINMPNLQPQLNNFPSRNHAYVSPAKSSVSFVPGMPTIPSQAGQLSRPNRALNYY